MTDTAWLDPTDLLLFARVAECGSFTLAATQLGWPKSTLSRRLSALEERLGERLMRRTTRRLTLTDFGAAVLEHAREVVAQTDATLALAEHRQAEPSGLLRVSMPADLAVGVLAPALARFARQHPQVSLELDLSSRRVDLVAENYDLALRGGVLADDATLSARRLATFEGGLYAAPTWAADHARGWSHPRQLLEGRLRPAVGDGADVRGAGEARRDVDDRAAPHAHVGRHRPRQIEGRLEVEVEGRLGEVEAPHLGGVVLGPRVVVVLRVQPHAAPRPRAPRAPRPLCRRGPRHLRARRQGLRRTERRR